MKGFKDFLFRGNLIEMAVAFIMATAFTAVVTSFTAIIMDILGKFGGVKDFSSVSVGGISIGAFLTALVSFVLIAFVLYFGLVKPYEMIKARTAKKQEEEPAAPTSEELLTEIRDLLQNK